jgi:membrane fusion protein, multidrug efflux system
MTETPAVAGDSAANGKRRRVLSIIALIFLIIGLAWFVFWWLVLSERERTDDAYVNGNKVTVSAQVTGTVIAIAADDTQLVNAGQALVRLDPIDAETNLSRAASSLAQAVRQVRQQLSMSEQYDSLIVSRRLEWQRALTDLRQREPLLQQQAIAPEELRHAREAVSLARAALDQAQRQAVAARALVDGTRVADNPAVLQARATYRDAWVSAHRNAIIAPVTGYVAERSVQLGSRVSPGQPLMTVIALHDLWIDANFKEVQLRHLRIGQPARIESDLYGGQFLFDGKVVGVGAGTGAAFSLLPAQNASGNWIKVVQRVPVRIEVNARQLKRYPLRVGLSTTVTVDTHDRSGPVLAAAPSTQAAADTDVYGADLERGNAAAEEIIARNMGREQ